MQCCVNKYFFSLKQTYGCTYMYESLSSILIVFLNILCNRCGFEMLNLFIYLGMTEVLIKKKKNKGITNF